TVVVVYSLGAMVDSGSIPDLLLLDPRSVPAEGYCDRIAISI
ncbi:hypothetical protein Tco_0687132, partial [Tanacetum coccineum]